MAATVGGRIKARRKDLGMGVQELAAALHKNRATVYRYENDDIADMPYTVLQALADALDTTPEYLMGLTDSYHDREPVETPAPISPGRLLLDMNGLRIYIDEDAEIPERVLEKIKGDTELLLSLC